MTSFLSMVFVFAFVAVTPTSAMNTLNSSNTTVLAVNCTQLAFDTQTRLMEQGWSMSDANTAANAAYDSCTSQQQ